MLSKESAKDELSKQEVTFRSKQIQC